MVGATRDLRNLFRSIWPKKTAVNLAGCTDLTVRQAERVLSGEVGLSGPVLMLLLNGEHGFLVLREIVKADPSWWRELVLEREIVEARKRRNAEAKRLQELEARAS